MKNKKGLTLVEVLIALSLVTMVMTVSVMIALMGLNTFRIDVSQSDVQFEVRRTTAKITEELRNALIISTNANDIIDSYDSPKPTVDEVLRIDLSKEINDVDKFECTYSLTDNIFEIYIKADKDTTSFDLTTKIMLNNPLESSNLSPNEDIIYYKLPEESDFESTF